MTSYKVDAYAVREGSPILKEGDLITRDGGQITFWIAPPGGEPVPHPCTEQASDAPEYFTYEGKDLSGAFFKSDTAAGPSLVGEISSVGAVPNVDVGIFSATQEGVNPGSDET